jgi:hypothetical protein
MTIFSRQSSARVQQLKLEKCAKLLETPAGEVAERLKAAVCYFYLTRPHRPIFVSFVCVGHLTLAVKYPHLQSIVQQKSLSFPPSEGRPQQQRPNWRLGLSRWRGRRFACQTPRVKLQPDVFIFIRFIHFRPIPATIVVSVDNRRKSIQSL